MTSFKTSNTFGLGPSGLSLLASFIAFLIPYSLSKSSIGFQGS